MMLAEAQNNQHRAEVEEEARTSSNLIKNFGIVATTAAACLTGAVLVVESPVILAGAAAVGATATLISGVTALVVK